MPRARERMLAEWSNKPIIEPPGFLNGFQMQRVLLPKMWLLVRW